MSYPARAEGLVNMDRTLSGATTLGQSGRENNGNEGIVRIFRSYSIIAASSSDCLSGHSVEKQSVYSTALTDWTTCWVGFTPLQRCSRCSQQRQPTGQLNRGILPICREAVGIFCTPSRLDKRPSEICRHSIFNKKKKKTHL